MEKTRKKGLRIVAVLLAVILLLLTIALAVAGGYAYWGPFKGLRINRMEWQFRERPKGETIFYGASNFALWKTLEEDMAPYAVQNHGFGGSTDGDMMKYADRILYPHEPDIVFVQTGSNDLIQGLNYEEMVNNKEKMYGMFREALPNTIFVVLSSIPMPGRSEYWPVQQQINAFLAEYCATHENMVFLDATDLLITPESDFRPELFADDEIHFNEEGRAIWGALIYEKLAELKQATA